MDRYDLDSTLDSPMRRVQTQTDRAATPTAAHGDRVPTTCETSLSPFFIVPEIDPVAMRRAREGARQAKKKRWWLQKRDAGLCHYCGQKFSPRQLTMDHIVPLARGGTSTPGNVVPACRNCNRSKSVLTPADLILAASADETPGPQASRQDAVVNADQAGLKPDSKHPE